MHRSILNIQHVFHSKQNHKWLSNTRPSWCKFPTPNHTKHITTMNKSSQTIHLSHNPRTQSAPKLIVLNSLASAFRSVISATIAERSSHVRKFLKDTSHLAYSFILNSIIPFIHNLLNYIFIVNADDIIFCSRHGFSRQPKFDIIVI